ncbi:MAG: glycoside hydrolase family 16 protein [Bacteroidota bacterium]
MSTFHPVLYLICSLYLGILLWGCNPGTAQNTSSTPATYSKLLWAEEFDYAGLPDSTKWDYRIGGHGWGNNEKQYYTDRLENARVEDGNLIIAAKKESYEGSDYTSAGVLTYGKQEFLYGRIEVRAKLPSAVGTWPAIWLLGNSIREGGRWPDCGEIDIMENVGFDPNIVHGNVHTKAYHHSTGTNKGDRITVEQPDSAFHTYAVEWHKDKIDFFVDDTQYFSFSKESDDPAVWPFDQPHYLIINLAIGGNWGGQQGINDDAFPHEYFVDYVRYYGE